MESSRRRLSGAAIALFVLASSMFSPAAAAGPLHGTALRIADFLLAQQDPAGAIPDAPGSKRVNEDSNMEYALIGLAAAYDTSGDPKYLTGLDAGIAWLAAREEMIDPAWKGTWFYAYRSSPPYEPIPTSPGGDVEDVRGVDATSALFAYLVGLRDRVTNTTAASMAYAPQVHAALDFLLAHNLRTGGYFASSWQLRSGVWKRWNFAYAADQGDVYLGLRAGSLMYGDAPYTSAADFLGVNVPPDFSTGPRFALGMDARGNLDTSMGGFNSIWPQGYLPWVFGANPADRRSTRWLDSRVRSDGAVAVSPRAPTFSLSAAILAMSRPSIGLPPPAPTLRWLVREACDPISVGVHDVGGSGPLYDNVAGFSVVALLDFPAWG